MKYPLTQKETTGNNGYCIRQKTKKLIRMKRMIINSLKRPVLAAGILASAICFNDAFAQNGEQTFKTTCSACHTVGGGKLVGPDLKGVTKKRKEQWLLKFIKGSQAFIKSGDADAKAIFAEFNIAMPDQNLSDAEIKGILSYIESQSPAEATAEAPVAEEPKKEESPKAGTETAAADIISKGMHLFEGSERFVNGGAACVSCHNVNYDGLVKGGVLAKDLTNCYSRLGGDAGIMGILGAPPFPAMTVAFQDKPLTEEEIFAITAFLNKADKDQVYQHPNNSNPLLYGGIVGVFLVFIAVIVIWYNRKLHTVKKDIYDRQIKSI